MKGNVLTLTICSILWRVSIDIIWPFLALYIMALGGEYETVGQVMAIGNLASLILYPLGGYIADYQGRIKVMAYMTFVYSFTFLIFVFTDSWVWVGVGLFAQSLITFYIPAMQALMADSLPPGKRGIGFAATMAIPSAFGIASPILGGWLIDVLGIKPAVKGLYLAGFFVALLVATLRLKFLKETLDSGGGMKITLGSLPGLIMKSYGDVIRVVREAPRRLIVLSLLISGCTFIVSLVSPFWIIRAKETIGLSTADWGVILLVNGAVNVLLSLPAGGFVDRYSKHLVAGICLILGAVPVYLFLYVTSFWQVLVIGVLIMLPNTFLNPSFQAMFTDMVPKEKRGRTIAALGGGGVWLMGSAWGTGVIAMLSMTAGSLLSGYVYRYNSSLPWMLLSVSLVILGILFITQVKESDKVED
ncbi:MAG: MFS transporter [Candidatus Bathyarchaeota archaeon]|nr:MFS transporter [Candidatus Bathyarchaeota archaeon]